MQKNIDLSLFQAEFRKDYVNSDHSFTLFSLINKYIKKNTYIAALYFQKAHDPIIRKSLKSFKKMPFIYFNESVMKMMKNAFCFMLKALFIFEILTFSPDFLVM